MTTLLPNYIDWGHQETCIRRNNTMTDTEVEQVLNSLFQANKKYNNPYSIPERIALTDKSGYTRHTIITKNGIPITVVINPTFSLTSIASTKLYFVVGLVTVGLIVAYAYSFSI